jgi:hypothetical protein
VESSVTRCQLRVDGDDAGNAVDEVGNDVGLLVGVDLAARRTWRLARGEVKRVTEDTLRGSMPAAQTTHHRFVTNRPVRVLDQTDAEVARSDIWKVIDGVVGKSGCGNGVRADASRDPREDDVIASEGR